LGPEDEGGSEKREVRRQEGERAMADTRLQMANGKEAEGEGGGERREARRQKGGSEEPEPKSQEARARSQELKPRSQEPGVKSQE
jgi:hypothetical protein